MFRTIRQSRSDCIFVQSIFDRIRFESFVGGTAEIVHERLQRGLKVIHILLIVMTMRHDASSGRLRGRDRRRLCRCYGLEMSHVLNIRLRTSGGVFVAVDV